MVALACQRQQPLDLGRPARLEALEARYGQKRYSQDDEETLIRAFFDDRRGGVFVDVGAGDPTLGSTTYYLERHLGWRGVAVDALAELAPAWQRARPATRFFSFFVGDRSDAVQEFFVAGRREFSSATAADPRAGGYTRTTVPTSTLDDLLARAGLDRIDFLSMDIEGAEPAALAGFSIGRFRPELVCVEIASPDHGRRIAGYMTRANYVEVTAFRDVDGINRYYTPVGVFLGRGR